MSWNTLKWKRLCWFRKNLGVKFSSWHDDVHDDDDDNDYDDDDDDDDDGYGESNVFGLPYKLFPLYCTVTASVQIKHKKGSFRYRQGTDLVLPQGYFLIGCALPLPVSYYTGKEVSISTGTAVGGGENKLSPPSCVEFKNAWSYSSTSKYIFVMPCLIRHEQLFLNIRY